MNLRLIHNDQWPFLVSYFHTPTSELRGNYFKKWSEALDFAELCEEKDYTGINIYDRRRNEYYDSKGHKIK